VVEIDEQIRQAQSDLEVRFELDALWVYGSVATGTANRRSDLDLAALFHGRPAPEDVLDAAAELAGRLGRDVDLVDLDRASPILGCRSSATGDCWSTAIPAGATLSSPGP
jgi:predicted nucleotidyltransferase